MKHRTPTSNYPDKIPQGENEIPDSEAQLHSPSEIQEEHPTLIMFPI